MKYLLFLLLTVLTSCGYEAVVYERPTYVEPRVHIVTYRHHYQTHRPPHRADIMVPRPREGHVLRGTIRHR